MDFKDRVTISITVMFTSHLKSNYLKKSIFSKPSHFLLRCFTLRTSAWAGKHFTPVALVRVSDDFLSFSIFLPTITVRHPCLVGKNNNKIWHMCYKTFSICLTDNNGHMNSQSQCNIQSSYEPEVNEGSNPKV